MSILDDDVDNWLQNCWVSDTSSPIFLQVCLLRDLCYLWPECGACIPRWWLNFFNSNFNFHPSSHHIIKLFVHFIFNERPSSRDVVEKKIERISLEGELSWVAGRKNRRAPNRCSYLTFPTSAHFIQTSSTQSHHDHHCCLHLWYICFPSVSKDLCGPRSSSPTNHTNSFCSKTLSW